MSGQNIGTIGETWSNTKRVLANGKLGSAGVTDSGKITEKICMPTDPNASVQLNSIKMLALRASVNSNLQEAVFR